ncbi:MAG: fumarylacetoacetate hydrolase family protein [Candidatus Melainabacteria bacterium]|nr:fumarylacetoacetate hydrolase family protein [Candidatus Melainabacteria bacterium]
MKLVTFEIRTVLGCFQRLGAWVQAGADPFAWIIDLNASYALFLNQEGESQPQRLANTVLPANMQGFLEMGSLATEAAHQAIANTQPALQQASASPETWPLGLNQQVLAYPETAIKLLCPLPVPRTFRDFITFETHFKASRARRGLEVPEAWYQMPVYYKGNQTAFIGPNVPVIWPRFTKKLDYELEWACIIGKQGRNIPVESAADYIAGFCILNDWSARDIQREEMTCLMGPAKGKDFATSMGPWLVTPDELPADRNLRMTAHINQTLWSEGYTATAHWTFEQMIAHVSQNETLYPGDVLGSGTVGNGCGLDLDRWLQPDDVVTLAVEGLGVLENRVLSPQETALQEAARNGTAAPTLAHFGEPSDATNCQESPFSCHGSSS